VTYSLVLPFHSNVASLAATTRRVRREGGERGIGEILLAHNGRPLDEESQRQVDALVAPHESGMPEVRFLDTPAKGIGAGYKLGIAAAREEFVVLSADDLPFGWSDIEAFERDGRPDFAIGSKAHPASKLAARSLRRNLSTLAFLAVRRLLLGRSTPADSQGSLILRTSVAKALLPDLEYDHYLSSLELATFHLARGGKIVEVPIVLEDVSPGRGVSVVRDGWRMMKELVKLRERVQKQRR